MSTQDRKDYANYKAGLILKGKAMGGKVPKHYYLPAINRMITAGEEAKAIKAIRQAYNTNPQTEFKQSFQAWWPKTAADILKGEVWPMIHDRINCRQYAN